MHVCMNSFFFFPHEPFREACWGFKLLELFVCGRRMMFGGGGTSQGNASKVHAVADLTVRAARPSEVT